MALQLYNIRVGDISDLELFLKWAFLELSFWILNCFSIHAQGDPRGRSIQHIAECFQEVEYLHLNPHIHFKLLIVSQIKNSHISHSFGLSQDQVQSGFVLNVVIRQNPPIFELLACEDDALDFRRDALHIVDLILHILNGLVERNPLQSDGGACYSFDIELVLATASSSETKHEM